MFELKNQYQKVAEDWDYEGRVWSPVELSHCFNEVQTRKEEIKSLSVIQMIDSLIEKFTHKERYKNGRIITSINNTRCYKEIKNSLTRFTQEVYNRSFSSYYFKEINERFLLDYTLYIQKVGIKNGNKGGLTQKLRRLRATCRYAEKQCIYGVDMKAFECLGDNIKWEPTTSKATSHMVLEKLEAVDRSLFSQKEQLHLDLFLFSYYTGGMSAIDVCLLTRNQIKDDLIIYDRTKYDKQARVIIIDKAAEIIERYRSEAYMNYVFPTIKRCNPTQSKLYGRVKRINAKVNETLRKICDHCGIKSRVTWGTARSSYISKMIDEGFHPLQVAELAGNSPQTIYRHYYTISDKEKMKQRMNKVF